MSLAQLSRRLSLTSALAVAALIALPRNGAAQSASYCGGKVVADAIYDTVKSNGKTSQVTYFGQFRNTSNTPVEALVRFVYPSGNRTFTSRLDKKQSLARYASVTLLLGAENLNNPSGQGKLDTTTVKSVVQVVCVAGT